MFTLFSENQNVHGSLKADGNKSRAQPSRCATKYACKLSPHLRYHQSLKHIHFSLSMTAKSDLWPSLLI